MNELKRTPLARFADQAVGDDIGLVHQTAMPTVCVTAALVAFAVAHHHGADIRGDDLVLEGSGAGVFDSNAAVSDLLDARRAVVNA